MKRILGPAVLAAVLIGPAPAVRASAQQDPIDTARKAALETPFSGRVTLQWREGGVLREEHLAVRGSHGAVLADGGRSVMAVGAERLVYYPGEGWHELWPSGLHPASPPGLGSSYETREMGYGRVAGRDTRVTEIRKKGVARERIDLDVATNVMLSRLQFDATGALERGFSFEQVRLPDPTVPALAIPASPKRDDPKPLRMSDLSSADRGPAQLAAGYRRLGVYRQAGAVQVLYGDGLSDVSLFEQHGRLDPADLPAPRRPMRVEGRKAWAFSQPGGEVVVWTAGRTVYTLVGDVPPDELAAVAASVPVHPSTSVTHRLRQACRGLVDSFTGAF